MVSVISLAKTLLWLPSLLIAYFLLRQTASTLRVSIVGVAAFLVGWALAWFLGILLVVSISAVAGYEPPADKTKLILDMMTPSFFWSIIGAAVGVFYARRARLTGTREIRSNEMDLNGLKTFLFSSTGRINRKKYLLGIMGIFGGFSLIGIAVALLLTANNFNKPDTLALAQGTFSPVHWVLALSVIPVVWINIALMIKRFHDFSFSGWWTIPYLITLLILGSIIDVTKNQSTDVTLVVSLIYVIFSIVVLLIPGSRGSNRFGNEWGTSNLISPTSKPEVVMQINDENQQKQFRDGSANNFIQWMYAQGDKSVGPVATAELKSLLQGRTISTKTLVWHQGMDGWQPVDSVAEFTAVLAPPLPTAAQPMSPPPIPRSEAMPMGIALYSRYGNLGYFAVGIVLLLAVGGFFIWQNQNQTASSSATVATGPVNPPAGLSGGTTTADNSAIGSTKSQDDFDKYLNGTPSVQVKLINPRTEGVTLTKIDQTNADPAMEESRRWTNPVTKKSFNLPTGWTSSCMGHPIRGEYCVLKNAKGKKVELAIDTGTEAQSAPDMDTYVKDWRRQATEYKLTKIESEGGSSWQGEGSRLIGNRRQAVGVTIIRGKNIFIRVTEINPQNSTQKDVDEGSEFGGKLSLSFD